MMELLFFMEVGIGSDPEGVLFIPCLLGLGGGKGGSNSFKTMIERHVWSLPSINVLFFALFFQFVGWDIVCKQLQLSETQVRIFLSNCSLSIIYIFPAWYINDSFG